MHLNEFEDKGKEEKSGVVLPIFQNSSSTNHDNKLLLHDFDRAN